MSGTKATRRGNTRPRQRCDHGEAAAFASGRFCPECAWGTACHKPRRPAWPRLVLIFAPLLVLLYMSTQTLSISYYVPSPGSRDLPHPDVLDPIITRGDLERFAAGDQVVRNGKRVRLADIFLKQVRPETTSFGATRYQVGFSENAGGSRHTWWHLGWPVEWCTIVQYRSYEDIVNGRPQTLAEQLPPDAWMNWDKYQTVQGGSLEVGVHGIVWDSGAPTPRLAQTSFYMWTFPLAAACLLSGSLCVLVCKALRFRSTRRSSNRLLVMLVVAGVFAAPILIPTMRESPSACSSIAAYSNQPTEHTSLYPGFAFVPLSPEELRSQRDQPGIDAVLATAILEAAPTSAPRATMLDETLTAAPEAHDDILFATVSSEYWETDATTDMWIEFGYSSWISWRRPVHERCADFGPRQPATMPPVVQSGFRTDGPSSLLVSGANNGAMPFELQVDLGWLAPTVVFALAPGVVPFWAYRAFARRREARRLKRCECPACGYPLQSPLESASGDDLACT